MSRTSLQLDRSGPWIGVTGLVVMLWLVISTVIYAPWWGVLLHLVVLACFVPVLRRTIATRPARATWVPLYALAAWFAVNAVGVSLFDWRT
ncbi:hypothetical protein [Aeromicrobium sp. 50.2.37]|uniref:hypothetical protein n=1 Tax=Aeromicrobium sp. 50.2.37 TaxID=2969305 RepID=UPI00215005AE|nr:hypothetical protein [Aeromicrobium sp. 50.2.37]MCR4512048.1 hypothetical protein [Aeromicrobium sp. 50.2.37]